MAQTQQAAEQLHVQPLTVLSEEERLFQASVREFAEAGSGSDAFAMQTRAAVPGRRSGPSASG